ncbi:GRAM domain-containing protein [Marinilactibacillus kalidii]|uniref:GRAM domain-containing protein n=1 Tax=Marinilactibacillus kalidii TaxID=2820274 RepID=UPI001ABEB437|nr:GRAM domain-containing protein [Marinilactibacillus kalidii]
MENKTIGLALPPEESIILEKRANKKKTWFNYLGGKIVLTNGAVYFKPHKFNTSYDITRVPLKDIHVLRKGSSFKLIPNRMIIGDQQGTEHVFVVSNREAFFHALETQLRNKEVKK